jgi:hypothetical protein
MFRRRARALTLLLAVLLIAAPLSSGDKGLWLSLTSTPVHHLETAPDRLPAELSMLASEAAARIASASTAARPERIIAPRTLGPAGAAWPPGSGERWTVVVSAPSSSLGDLAAARPAPRAPPA